MSENIEYLSFGFDEALEYFDQDATMLEFLEILDEDEKDDLHLEIMLDHEKESAEWSIGNWVGESEHLHAKTGKIDNSYWEEDDYPGVMEFLEQKRGE